LKILVTGGAGFIGSHLCERLLGEGNRVTALDNFDPYYEPSVKRANLAECLRADEFRLVDGDIRDESVVGAIFRDEEIELVVHLAAKAGVRASREDPVGFADVNVRGTQVLLESARRAGVKQFVLASSSSVYGNNNKVPFSEEDTVNEPISPYAATKRACELLGHVYYHLYGMTVTCLRFFTVFGPRQRPDLAIHTFARRMMRKERIPVYGDGSMQRDYTYIDDIVDGIQAAMKRESGYRIYNLGGSHPVRLDRLIAEIEKAMGVKAIIQRLPEQPGDVRQTYADIRRSQTELNYQPRTDLADGLKSFIAWLDKDKT
jgi:UDP-glucuronate 4-epimerase